MDSSLRWNDGLLTHVIMYKEPMKINRHIICCLLLFSALLFTQTATAHISGIRKYGDDARYAIPAIAGVSTLFHKDWQGLIQFGLGLGFSQLTTEGLKSITHERRPRGNSHKSFPSGHVSAAFASAAFVHFRYGFKYGVLLYIPSIVVAYSRVHVRAHHVHDVIAGAALGIASAYLFTSRFGKADVYPIIGPHLLGIGVEVKT